MEGGGGYFLLWLKAWELTTENTVMKGEMLTNKGTSKQEIKQLQLRLFYLSFQLLFFAKLSNKINLRIFFFFPLSFFIPHTNTNQCTALHSVGWFLFHGLNHHFRIDHKAPRLPPLKNFA